MPVKDEDATEDKGPRTLRVTVELDKMVLMSIPPSLCRIGWQNRKLPRIMPKKSLIFVVWNKPPFKSQRALFS